jgi:hypothetical protein
VLEALQIARFLNQRATDDGRKAIHFRRFRPQATDEAAERVDDDLIGAGSAIDPFDPLGRNSRARIPPTNPEVFPTDVPPLR